MGQDVFLILIKLQNSLGENKIKLQEGLKQPTVYIESEVLNEAMQLLKEEFNFLADLTAVEYEEHIETVYHLMSLDDCSELQVKVKLAKDNPRVMSLVSYWSAANVQEREAFDMFGIEFLGHPHLQSILLPEDSKIHPLRKNFKLAGSNGER